MGSFSIWHWLIVLVIVLVIFGTKKLPKLKDIGGDLGGAVKSFKDAVHDGQQEPPVEANKLTAQTPTQVMDNEVKDASHH